MLPLPGFVFKGIALYTPVPWPKGVPTMPGADQAKAGTPPDDFERDRIRLTELIDEFANTPAGPARPPHPLFKKMSDRDWGRWGYRHTDHHLRQFSV